jgi:hypothetical protein
MHGTGIAEGRRTGEGAMSEYLEVPESAAAEIAERYKKSIVVVNRYRLEVAKKLRAALIPLKELEEKPWFDEFGYATMPGCKSLGDDYPINPVVFIAILKPRNTSVRIKANRNPGCRYPHPGLPAFEAFPAQRSRALGCCTAAR